MDFYKNENYLTKMLKIITGESKISLRIVDWFATNYAKKNYTLYPISTTNGDTIRFKVYFDYKLKLKAYSKDACIRHTAVLLFGFQISAVDKHKLVFKTKNGKKKLQMQGGMIAKADGPKV